MLNDRNTGEFKGVAFVTCSSAENVQAVLQLNGTYCKSNAVRINLANGGASGGASSEVKSVFVGSLPDTSTADNLRQYFSQCGDIRDLRLSTHADTGRPKCAHVDFSSVEGATAAIGLSGEQFNGSSLFVELARSKGGDRGGFRGGHGGGGDRGGFRGGRGGGGDRGGFRGGRGGFRGGDRGGFRGGRGGFRGGRGGRGGGAEPGGDAAPAPAQ